MTWDERISTIVDPESMPGPPEQEYASKCSKATKQKREAAGVCLDRRGR